MNLNLIFFKVHKALFSHNSSQCNPPITHFPRVSFCYKVIFQLKAHVRWLSYLSALCDSSRGTVVQEYGRISVVIALFLCFGPCGWEDTLIRCKIDFYALLYNGNTFPLHLDLSSWSFQSQLWSHILQQALVAPTRINCHFFYSHHSTKHWASKLYLSCLVSPLDYEFLEWEMLLHFPLNLQGSEQNLK